MASVHELLLAVLGDATDARATLAGVAREVAEFDSVQGTAHLEVDIEDSRAKVQQMIAQLRDIDRDHIDIEARIRTDLALASLHGLEAELTHLGEQASSDDLIDLERPFQQARTRAVAELSRLSNEVESVTRRATDRARVTVRVDFEGLDIGEREIDRVENRLRELSRSEGMRPEMRLNASQALLQLELVRRRIAAVREEGRRGGGLIDAGSMAQALSAIGGAVSGAERAAGAIEGLAGEAAQAEGVVSRLGSVFGQVFGEGALGQFAGHTRDLQEAVQGVGMVIVGALIPAIIALGGAIAAAIVGVGGLATAFVAALGPAVVLIVALFQRFAAILKARQAQQQQDNNATRDAATAQRQAAQAEQARHAAAVQLRDALQQEVGAERRVTEARKQAREEIQRAISAERDAHRQTVDAAGDVQRAEEASARARIEARRRIAAADRQAADDARSAARVQADNARAVQRQEQENAQRLGDAERSLGRTRQENARRLQAATASVADAQKTLQEAVRDAYQEWSDAIERVKDDQLALEDAILGVADAQLSLEEAQQRVNDLLAKTPQLAQQAFGVLQRLQDVDVGPDAFAGVSQQIMQVGGESPTDSALELRRALLELARAKLGVQQATDRQSDSEKELAGDQQTVNDYAREGIAAYQPYRDAIAGVAAANRDLAQTQRDNATAFADAQREVRRAASEGARTLADLQRTNARTLADALRQARTSAAEARRLHRQGIEDAPEVISAVNEERSARERLAGAIRTEARAHAERVRLERQGVEGNPQVISALDGLRDAHERVTEAQRRAKTAGRDAFAALPADVNKTQNALDQLDASETRFLGTLNRAIDLFKGLLRPATDILFNALSDAFTLLEPFVGRLGGLFTGIAQVWADAIRSGARALLEPAWRNALQRIFGGTLRLSRPALDMIGSLLVIFRNIAVAVMPLLIRLFDDGARALGGLAAKTNNIRDLRDFFGPMVDSVRAFIGLVGALGNVFLAFAEAVGPIGTELVRWITQGANKFADWMRSAEGSRQITDFFRDTLPLARAVVGFVVQFGIFLARLLQLAAPVLTPLIELFRHVFEAVQHLYGILLNLLHLNFGDAAREAGRLVDAVVGVFSDPAALAKAAAFGAALAAAIGATAAIFRVVGGALAQALALGLRAGAAIAAAAARAVMLAVQVATAVFGPIFAAVGGAIVTAISAGMRAAAAAAAAVAAVIGTVIETAIVLGPFVLLGAAIIAAILAAFHFRRPIADAAKKVGGWIVDGVKAVWRALQATGGFLIGHLVAGIRAAVRAVRAVATSIASAIVNGVASAVRAVAGVATAIVRAIASRLSAFFIAARNLGGRIINFVISGIRSGIRAVGSAASAVVNAFTNAFRSVGGFIAGIFRGVVNGVGGAINVLIGAIDWLINAINRIPNIRTPFGNIGIPDIPLIPKIPRLQAGGLATGPTLAQIGEAGREAVLPLTGTVMTELAGALAEQMSAQARSLVSRGVQAAATGGGGGELHQHFHIPPPPAAPRSIDPTATAALLAQDMRRRAPAAMRG